jgi:hypothetical protein
MRAACEAHPQRLSDAAAAPWEVRLPLAGFRFAIIPAVLCACRARNADAQANIESRL